MLRQVYGRHPETGVICHHYRDEGPKAALPSHGTKVNSSGSSARNAARPGHMVDFRASGVGR